MKVKASFLSLLMAFALTIPVGVIAPANEPVPQTNGAEQSGYSSNIATAHDIQNWAKANDLFRKNDGLFTPAIGDLVFYDLDGDTVADIVGVVRKDDEIITVSAEAKKSDKTKGEILGYASTREVVQSDNVEFAPDFTWV